jgi:hypothetical protein
MSFILATAVKSDQQDNDNYRNNWVRIHHNTYENFFTFNSLEKGRNEIKKSHNLILIFYFSLNNRFQIFRSD